MSEEFEAKTCAACNRTYKSQDDYLQNTSRWRKCDLGHLWFNCSCGSTLILRKGKYSWYRPEAAMSEKAATVFNKLGGLKELPHLPHPIMQLQQLITAKDFDPNLIAQELRNSPIVAASLLQVTENLRRARSPENPPIKSLVHAIVYVGKDALSDIVTTAAIRHVRRPPSNFDDEKFWRESYLTASLSEILAARLEKEISGDEAYIAGMLANIGKLITAICFPALVTKISNDINDPKKLKTWRESERSYKFPDHTILGEVAATLWGLPNFVMESVRYHHDKPHEADAKEEELPRKTFWVVALANQLKHWVLGQPHLMEMELLAKLREAFFLSEKDLEDIVADLLHLRDEIDASLPTQDAS